MRSFASYYQHALKWLVGQLEPVYIDMWDAGTDSKFGSRLRAARQFRGLTQAQLAERANVAVTSIAHLETGARKPSLDTFVRLASALEVQSDFLIGLQDQPAIRYPESPIAEKIDLMTSDQVQQLNLYADFLLSRGA